MTPEAQSFVPHEFRNVICPWQTRREINAQTKFLRKLLAKVPKVRHAELLGHARPDRVWWRKP